MRPPGSQASRRKIAALAALAALATGCEGSAKPASASGAPAIYQRRCAACHGEAGRGDGPVAARLDPPPPSFRDPAWAREAQDERIRRAIVEGGAAVGRSPAMPPNRDLSPEEVEALVRFVRQPP